MKPPIEASSDDARPISVLLVDDQSLMREGLRTLLELHDDLHIVGEASDGLQAETLVERLHPDVVLMDLRMPRCDGVSATRRIVERRSGVRVLVLTTFDDDDLVFQSIEAGATGYLLKDVGSEVLAEAVRAASRGESPIQPSVASKLLGRLRGGRVDAPPITAPDGTPRLPGEALAESLTPRERAILERLSAGASNREIAEQLCLTDGTVKNYVSTLLGKTGLRDRTQLALWAIRQRLI